MKTLFRTLLLIVTLSVVATGNGYAQKKSETKLYNSVLAKGDTTSFNKFLAKYPKSVYAPKVQAKKDSLIKSYNTTSYTIEQAVGIVKDNIAALQGGVAGKDFVALPHKKNNVEYVTVVIAPHQGNAGSLNIVKLQQNGTAWQVAAEKSESRYMQSDELALFAFVPQDSFALGQGQAQEVTIKGERYLQFSYFNYTNTTDSRSKWVNNDAELVTNLVSLADETLFSAMYSGELADNTLNGSSADASQGGALATPQMDYLIRSFAKHPALKPLNKERAVTKEAIKWWYQNNPAGKTTLEFGVLEESHPIVQLFLKDKYQETSGNNTAAFFDIMETTVLCVYNKGTKQYLLVWCEPQAKDKKTEKMLNTIYFEKGNTVVLYYYHGNRTLKERINLGTRKKS